MTYYPCSNILFSKYRQFFEFERKDYRFKVDIETGKLLFDKKLITLKGAHLPIDLHLKYFQDFFEPYGEIIDYTGLPKGFKFNYHVFISLSGSDYRYVDLDGFTHVFKLAVNSSSLYYDSCGTGLTMKFVSGCPIIEDDQQNYQQFDSNGRLIKIHQQVSLSQAYEIDITYSSDLIISSISDSYGHTIYFDYTNPSQIKVQYNSQNVFALNVSNNKLTSIYRYTSSIDHFDELFDWVNDGLEELELATGEAFTLWYSSSKVSAFNTNYKQNYYSFSYYPSDKKAEVANSRNVVTVYNYDQKQLVFQTQDNNVDLGYLSLSKDASTYTLKNNVPSGQSLLFNLSSSGDTACYQYKNVGVGSLTTASVYSSTLLAKRNYVVHAQITADLGNSSAVIEMYNSSNKLLARLTFEGKTSVMVAPVGLYGTSGITDSYYLKIYNNTNAQITINKVRLIPLLGNFSVLATNTSCFEGTYSYGTNSYYFLTKGKSFSFKNGGTTVVTPSGVDLFVSSSDYLANEKLFRKRTGGSFNFWCNDKTLLIEGITEAAIGLGVSILAIYYHYDNKDIILRQKSTPLDPPTYIRFYKISGSDDNSFSATEISHGVLEDYVVTPTGTYYLEKETRYICDNQSIIYRFYNQFYDLLLSNKNDGKNIENTYDSYGNLLSETLSVNNETYSIVKTKTYDSYANVISEQSLVGTSLQTKSYSYNSDNSLSLTSNPNSLNVAYTYEAITNEKIDSVTYYRYSYDTIPQTALFDNDEVVGMTSNTNSYLIDYNKGDVSGIWNNNRGIIGFTYYSQIYDGHVVFDNYYTYFSNGYAFQKVFDRFNRIVADEYLAYSYDDFSNVTSILDGTINSQDNHINYSYDYYDRLTAVVNEGNDLLVTFSYDCYQRVAEQEFEELGSGIYYIEYGYYNVSGLETNTKESSISFGSNGLEIEDNVDNYSRLADRTVTVNNSQGLLYQFSYCHNLNQTNDTIQEVEYREITNGVVSSSFEKDTYYYDSIGNIAAVMRSFSGGQTPYLCNYVYDDFGRLIRENNPLLNRSYTYSYDQRGNIVSKYEYYYSTGTLNNPINSRTYYYDLYCKDRIVSYGAELFTYDNYGNPTMYRDAYLAWTRGTLLASYSKGLKEVQFDYDGFKNRTKKAILHDSTLTAEITYDYIDGILLRENRPNNNSLTFIYSHAGIVGFSYQNNVYFYEKNIQQDVTGIRDSSNQIVARYIYDAWGNHTVLNYSASNIGYVNPIRYRSYYYDTDLGMYWLTSRYYDPEMGRFVSPDDWSYLKYENFHGLNLYAYSKNNPVMYYDPSGHAVWFLFALLAAVVISTYLGMRIRDSKTKDYDSLSEEEKEGVIESEPLSDGTIIKYSVFGEWDKDDTKLKIYDSWKYSPSQIQEFLVQLKNSINKGDNAINVDRIRNEWIWHNIGFAVMWKEEARSLDVYLNADDDHNDVFAWIINKLKWW